MIYDVVTYDVDTLGHADIDCVTTEVAFAITSAPTCAGSFSLKGLLQWRASMLGFMIAAFIVTLGGTAEMKITDDYIPRKQLAQGLGEKIRGRGYTERANVRSLSGRREGSGHQQSGSAAMSSIASPASLADLGRSLVALRARAHHRPSEGLAHCRRLCRHRHHP